jgi:hypothetical protein
MKSIYLSCVFLIWLLAVRNDEAAETNLPTVGPLREFDHFKFEGNQTFSSRNLWINLNNESAFPNLSHPLAPRAPFMAAIQQFLKLGYQHNGFPDTSVTVTIQDDPAKPVAQVKIQEGRRFVCGPVEVLGAHSTPVASLVRGLTETNTDAATASMSFKFLNNSPNSRTNDLTGDATFWAAGQPAYFDPISRQQLSNKVSHIMAMNGFFSPQMKLIIVTNLPAATATLQVNIADEGPVATVDAIEITGNQRNRSKAILDYLDLKPGMKFDATLITNLQDKLYLSARFLTNLVSTLPGKKPDQINLKIDVLENDTGPTLEDAFNPVEKTLLTARNWLADAAKNGEELVLTVTGYADNGASLDCVVSPSQGWLVEENQPVSGTNQVRHVLLLATNEIICYAPTERRKFAGTVFGEGVNSYFSIESHAPDAEGSEAEFNIDADLKDLSDSTGLAPCTVALSIAPAAFLQLEGSTNSSNWFANGQLVISNSTSVMKFDAQSGRLNSSIYRPASGTNGAFYLHFEKSVFAKKLRETQDRYGNFENAYLTNAPWSSTLSFWVGEIARLDPVNSYLRTRLPVSFCDELPQFLRQKDVQNCLSIFESLKSLKLLNGDEEQFIIPEAQIAEDNTWAAAGKYLSGYADEMLPPHSWPWTAMRDMGLYLEGNTDYLMADTERMYDSPETGPLGFLALAETLKDRDTSTAKMAAARGLERLSTEDFRCDYKIFLDEHYFCGNFIAQAGNVLKKIDDPELNEFTGFLPPAEANLILDCRQRLQTAPGWQSLVATIGPALDTFWQKNLSQRVSDALKKIANE